MAPRRQRFLLAVLCAISLPLGVAATPALATHFQSESYAELLAQLHKREIVAIVLHPSGPVAHVSARNGQHFTVTYTQAEVAPLRVAAGAGGSSFAISTAKPKSKTTHHKLRYIAGGVLIVVIVVVLIVLLLGRRRAIEEDGPGSGGGTASGGGVASGGGTAPGAGAASGGDPASASPPADSG